MTCSEAILNLVNLRSITHSNYVTLINGETSNDKKVATAVNEYIQQSKNKRCTVSKRPLSVNTIIQNQMNSDSGVIEMRR